LIADETGTPSPYGVGFRDHLQTLAAQSNLTSKVAPVSFAITQKGKTIKVRSAKVQNG